MEKDAPRADDRPDMRIALVVATGVLGVLGVFAWRYYLERTACFDSAFFSWLMLEAGHPISVLGRYGSWIAQVLPVLMMKIGASLEVVLRSYSLAFILVHALVLYLVAFRLKERRAVVALALTLTTGFHYMFYYGISELYQGLSLTVLLWVLIRRAWSAASPTGWVVAAVALNVVISFFHQLLVLPLVFILVFEALEEQRWRKRGTWLLGIVLVAWYVARITLMAKSTYEESRMPHASDLVTYLFRLGELNSTAYLLMVWTKFKALLLVIAVGTCLLVWQRSWLRLAWTLVFSTAFLTLILIVDRDGMAPVIYENYYPVIGMVWAIAFASELDRISGLLRKMMHGVFVVACALGLLQIHRAHYRLTERVNYLQRITDYQAELGIRKGLVRFDNFPWSYTLVHWAVGMESALVSAVKAPDEASTIFISDDLARVAELAPLPHQFLGPSWAPNWFPMEVLDTDYFRFPEDVGYTWICGTDPVHAMDRLRILPPEEPYRLVPDRFTVVPIRLENTGQERFASCAANGKPLQFLYQLLREDGTIYQESAHCSSMEVDIAPGTAYMQGLVLERPVDNGRYTVRSWLSVEGRPLGEAFQFEVVADSWPF
ncbi:MAG: hypothetical protein IT225_04895 [Flavobacteriales bacterium]|jgi:hypothetical protein|nr:hypothetical protein [Flavobacteriales bacterium]